MTAPAAPANEFLDLMCDLAEGRLSPPQTARLEELLQADPARRRQYVYFMLIVGGLHRIRGEGQGRGLDTSVPSGFSELAPSGKSWAKKSAVIRIARGNSAIAV